MIWWDMIWKMPSSYISLIVRVAFRNPRFLEGLEQGRLTLWRWASDEWTLKATEHKQACGKLWHALTSFERTCWRHCQVILDYHEKVLSECRGSWGLWERERRGNQSYRPVSLTLIPGKVMEQILLKSISKRWRTGTWLGVGSIDLQRSHSSRAWYPMMRKLVSGQEKSSRGLS